MGKKIFVSYKYSDSQVENLTIYENSTVRDYVTKFEEILDPSDNMYKGESEGEDLSILSEETICKKLKDRIYDSSVTVVFISPGMKESWKAEKDRKRSNQCTLTFKRPLTTVFLFSDVFWQLW